MWYYKILVIYLYLITNCKFGIVASIPCLEGTVGLTSLFYFPIIISNKQLLWAHSMGLPKSMREEMYFSNKGKQTYSFFTFFQPKYQDKVFSTKILSKKILFKISIAQKASKMFGNRIKPKIQRHLFEWKTSYWGAWVANIWVQWRNANTIYDKRKYGIWNLNIEFHGSLLIYFLVRCFLLRSS